MKYMLHMYIYSILHLMYSIGLDLFGVIQTVYANA